MPGNGVTWSPGAITLSGSGVLVVTGSGTINFGNQNLASYVSMSPGGLIDIKGGSTVRNNDVQGWWGANFASMTVESGAILDLFAQGVNIDALNGAGTAQNSYTPRGTQTLTVGAAGGSGTFSGNIGGSQPAYIALTKAGSGMETLSGANTYTSYTTIGGGTLKLDFSAAGAPASNILSSSSPLVLSGGVLVIQGSASATSAQTVNGTAINAGYSSIAVFNGSGGTANLTLGAITHNAGGFVDFTLPSSGSIGTTTANGASGILGPWATVGARTGPPTTAATASRPTAATPTSPPPAARSLAARPRTSASTRPAAAGILSWVRPPPP